MAKKKVRVTKSKRSTSSNTIKGVSMSNANNTTVTADQLNAEIAKLRQEQQEFFSQMRGAFGSFASHTQQQQQLQTQKPAAEPKKFFGVKVKHIAWGAGALALIAGAAWYFSGDKKQLEAGSSAAGSSDLKVA